MSFDSDYHVEQSATGDVTLDKDTSLLTAIIAAPANVTLPLAADCKGDKAKKTIINDTTSASTLSFVAAGSDTIVGITSSGAGDGAVLESDGYSKWFIVRGSSGVGATVTEAELSLADNTTRNATSALHGLMPKLTPGVATASAPVTLGASKNLDVLALPVSGLKIGAAGAEVAVDPSAAEFNVLDGATAGTVVASKAVVVDSNKDIGDFRNLDAINVDAGSSGVAGSVDVFPTTALKGKLAITKADNTNDDTTTLAVDLHGQATTVHVPDGGAAASYVAQSTAALSLAEVDVLDGAIGGTQVASKATVVDAQKATDTLRATTNLNVGGTGVPGAASVQTEITKAVTAFTDTVAKDVFTVTVPNAAHAALIELDLLGVLGAGGAIGAGESVKLSKYQVVLSRTAGVAVVPAVSAAIGGVGSKVLGGDDITSVVATLSAITGAVGDPQTFTILVAITRSGAGADNHTLLATARIVNANATGVTIA